MTTRRRFWVEVTPRFAVPDVGPAAGRVIHSAPAGMSAPDAASSADRAPRLTELAVAVGLEGSELDAELASVRAQRSQLAAYEAGLIERKATLGAQHPLPFLPGARTDVRTGPDAAPDDDDPVLQAADDFLADEVAVLLNMSVPSARHHVDHSLTLVRQLPAVWHALADRRIDETRAKVIVRALAYQAVSHGGPVADSAIADLAALGVEWAARGCPPSTLRERLDTALIAADPAAADRRRQLRKRAADVTVHGTGDGLADLTATQLDAADAKLARAQIDAYARKIKADGDTRPIGAIRLTVLTAMITRPWEKRDPAVAQVTINAELADLIDSGHLPDLSTLPRLGDDIPAANSAGAAAAADGPTGGGDTGNNTIGPDTAGADNVRTRVSTVGAGQGAKSAPPEPHAERSRAAQPQFGPEPPDPRPTRPPHGTGAGHVDDLPVTPAAVRALLQHVDALGLTDPQNGNLTYTLTGHAGRLLAVATPDELTSAVRHGHGLGPPGPTPGYTPTAAQYRYLRARDRHCRFPGCRAVALACDVDHVIPFDHQQPGRGGRTCVTNLALLCRHHHRLKTHAKGWAFRLDPDGTLHVTTPGGTTRTTRPPAADQILDLMNDPPPRHDPDDDPPPF